MNFFQLFPHNTFLSLLRNCAAQGFPNFMERLLLTNDQTNSFINNMEASSDSDNEVSNDQQQEDKEMSIEQEKEEESSETEELGQENEEKEETSGKKMKNAKEQIKLGESLLTLGLNEVLVNQGLSSSVVKKSPNFEIINTIQTFLKKLKEELIEKDQKATLNELSSKKKIFQLLNEWKAFLILESPSLFSCILTQLENLGQKGQSDDGLLKGFENPKMMHLLGSQLLHTSVKTKPDFDVGVEIPFQFFDSIVQKISKNKQNLQREEILKQIFVKRLLYLIVLVEMIKQKLLLKEKKLCFQNIDNIDISFTFLASKDCSDMVLEASSWAPVMQIKFNSSMTVKIIPEFPQELIQSIAPLLLKNVTQTKNLPAEEKEKNTVLSFYLLEEISEGFLYFNHLKKFHKNLLNAPNLVQAIILLKVLFEKRKELIFDETILEKEVTNSTKQINSHEIPSFYFIITFIFNHLVEKGVINRQLPPIRAAISVLIWICHGFKNLSPKHKIEDPNCFFELVSEKSFNEKEESTIFSDFKKHYPFVLLEKTEFTFSSEHNKEKTASLYLNLAKWFTPNFAKKLFLISLEALQILDKRSISFILKGAEPSKELKEKDDALISAMEEFDQSVVIQKVFLQPQKSIAYYDMHQKMIFRITENGNQAPQASKIKKTIRILKNEIRKVLQDHFLTNIINCHSIICTSVGSEKKDKGNSTLVLTFLVSTKLFFNSLQELQESACIFGPELSNSQECAEFKKLFGNVEKLFEKKYKDSKIFLNADFAKLTLRKLNKIKTNPLPYFEKFLLASEKQEKKKETQENKPSSKELYKLHPILLVEYILVHTISSSMTNMLLNGKISSNETVLDSSRHNLSFSFTDPCFSPLIAPQSEENASISSFFKNFVFEGWHETKQIHSKLSSAFSSLRFMLMNEFKSPAPIKEMRMNYFHPTEFDPLFQQFFNNFDSSIKTEDECHLNFRQRTPENSKILNLTPIPVIMELESSSKWPDTLLGIQKLKHLIMLRIYEVLGKKGLKKGREPGPREKVFDFTIPNYNSIDVLYKDFLFRIVLFVKREVQVLLSSGHAMNPKVQLLQREMINKSRHEEFLTAFASSFAPSNYSCNLFTESTKMLKTFFFQRLFFFMNASNSSKNTPKSQKLTWDNELHACEQYGSIETHSTWIELLVIYLFQQIMKIYPQQSSNFKNFDKIGGSFPLNTSFQVFYHFLVFLKENEEGLLSTDPEKRKIFYLNEQEFSESEKNTIKNQILLQEQAEIEAFREANSNIPLPRFPFLFVVSETRELFHYWTGVNLNLGNKNVMMTTYLMRDLVKEAKTMVNLIDDYFMTKVLNTDSEISEESEEINNENELISQIFGFNQKIDEKIMKRFDGIIVLDKSYSKMNANFEKTAKTDPKSTKTDPKSNFYEKFYPAGLLEKGKAAMMQKRNILIDFNPLFALKLQLEDKFSEFAWFEFIGNLPSRKNPNLKDICLGIVWKPHAFLPKSNHNSEFLIAIEEDSFIPNIPAIVQSIKETCGNVIAKEILLF